MRWSCIPSSLATAAHNSDVNCAPQSEVVFEGDPKLAIQSLSPRAQDLVDVSHNGMASSHLVNLSTMVNRYLNPRDDGSGPTRSTLIWSNRRCGTAKVCNGALVWPWTFAVWHGTQALAQVPTCLQIPCHMNFAVRRFCVVQIEGCKRLCTAPNTCWRKADGTNGHGWPADTSQTSEVPAGPKVTSSRTKPVGHAEGGQLCVLLLCCSHGGIIDAW